MRIIKISFRNTRINLELYELNVVEVLKNTCEYILSVRLQLLQALWQAGFKAIKSKLNKSLLN